MIVSVNFDGDNNDILKWVQHDSYGKLLGYLVVESRRKYLDACRFINHRSDFSKQVLSMDHRFDHRVLQETHDTIAAWYRYKFADRVAQLHLPLEEGPLFTKNQIEEIYEAEWTQFWYSQVRELTDDGRFTRAILTAVIFQNSTKGYEAEDELVSTLLDYCYAPLPKDINLGSSP